MPFPLPEVAPVTQVGPLVRLHGQPVADEMVTAPLPPAAGKASPPELNVKLQTGEPSVSLTEIASKSTSAGSLGEPEPLALSKIWSGAPSPAGFAPEVNVKLILVNCPVWTS